MRLLEKLLFVNILFFTFKSQIYSQELCLKLDSINVYYIPWNATTPIAVKSENIIDGHYKEVTSTKSIIDSLVLADFTKINIQNESKFYENGSSLDVRMVLILYLGKTALQVSLNNFKSYSFLGYNYQFSPELIAWIDTNITPCKLGPW